MKSKRKQKAFTLIELLVVIAIIALLLSIMMPALGMVKEKARAVICRSNIRQWGTLFALYTNDYNGTLPPHWSDNRTPGNPSGTWIISMESYYGGANVDDEQISVCPSTKKGKETEGATDPHTWIWEETASDGRIYRNSYAINNYASSTTSGIQGLWERTGQKQSNNIPLFMEGWRWGGGFSERHMSDDVPPTRDEITKSVNYPTGRYLVDRHDLAINVLFMDSHVEEVGFKALWDLKWHKTYDTNGDYPDWPEWMKNAKGEK
ncbi:putative major pilin subunit [Anaerohalosphaera lusitana]|uniref:Putative major pilin subunit n=1 Tax=Anaerohalosphaera lusitana TaxID=1936003 RepID=A0A1U9NGW6_9BACT|nr:type II secretion system protein [Anaerohalosphaera lusitana]AQT66984.1 putative major pilin subunit [Anaerohalosphaera lusitana]